MVDLVTNDTGSKLQVSCKDNDTDEIIVLTGAVVHLRWEDDAGVIQTRIMTIIDEVAGTCEYLFVSGEIIYPRMKFEVSITGIDGRVISNLSLIELTVREELG